MNMNCSECTIVTLTPNFVNTLLEKMVLFRTRNGSIPRFIYGTPNIEPFFFLVKGSIGQDGTPGFYIEPRGTLFLK